MIQSIMKRRSSFLAQREWQGDIPVGGGHNPAREVVDHGFEIAALLEAADALAPVLTDPRSVPLVIQHLTLIHDLVGRLEASFLRLLQRQGTALACDICAQKPCTFSDFGTDRTASKAPEQPLPVCDFFVIANLMLALRIALALPAQGILGKLGSQPDMPADLARLLAKTRTFAGFERQRYLGSLILDMARHCLHPELGLNYNRNTMVPLQTALWIFLADPERKAECVALIDVLYQDMGVQLARHINKGQEHVPLLARTQRVAVGA